MPHVIFNIIQRGIEKEGEGEREREKSISQMKLDLNSCSTRKPFVSFLRLIKIAINKRKYLLPCAIKNKL